MVRLFQTHVIRTQTELDGMWEFTPVAETAVPEKFEYTLPVPGCWEQHPSFLNYRGKGAYRRELLVHKRGNLRLEFKGVSHTADVYFDGKLIAHHYNAFTPFSAVVKDVAEGSHELTVLADNSFSEKSALHLPNDYYTYGGIIRPVVLEEVGDTYIDHVEFTPDCPQGKWNASIRVFVKNVADHAASVHVSGNLEKQRLDFPAVRIEAGQTAEVAQTFDFDGVEPWSGEHPKLYMLQMRLSAENEPKAVDDFIERVGFRTVRVEGRQVCVNGKPVFLKGFCRHEDFGLVGCAIPLQLMVKDIDLMQQMGVNSVRTSHYPNDERFLDLCDERGIFVWEEGHARGLTREQMLNPNFVPQSLDCIDEMIHNHFCHPSVIIWALLNECASDSCRDIYERLIREIRSLDGSRPVSFATCKFFTDICLDLPDIVSINLYYGWYNDEDIAESFPKQLAYIEEHGGAGKPVIISEFGGAAVYGMRDPAHPRWSEERQADILDLCLSYYMNRPEIIGTYIWQYADCRVTNEGTWYMTRPGTRNNKGVVDLYRRPKLAFETVKQHYSGRKD